jgi:hypothetical protein
MDATAASVTIITVVGATVGVLSPEATEMSILLLLPLIGAILVTGGAIMLNPTLETRKITMGRAFFGFLVGVPGPWALTSMVNYWGMVEMEKFLKLPPILILTGSAICLGAFILSHPFCRRFYERSDEIARHKVTQLERLSGMQPRKKREDREE